VTRVTAAATGALLFAFTVATVGDGEARRLELLNERGRRVWVGPLAAGESFDVSFVHSAERCRWTQHYREHARRIEQTASTFPCYGAGMPTDRPTETTAAGFRVAAVQDLRALVMWHSSVADITIGHRAAVHRVADHLNDGERFVLRVR
jgi:hypothetical protein